MQNWETHPECEHTQAAYGDGEDHADEEVAGLRRVLDRLTQATCTHSVFPEHGCMLNSHVRGSRKGCDILTDLDAPAADDTADSAALEASARGLSAQAGKVTPRVAAEAGTPTCLMRRAGPLVSASDPDVEHGDTLSAVSASC